MYFISCYMLIEVFDSRYFFLYADDFLNVSNMRRFLTVLVKSHLASLRMKLEACSLFKLCQQGGNSSKTPLHHLLHVRFHLIDDTCFKITIGRELFNWSKLTWRILADSCKFFIASSALSLAAILPITPASSRPAAKATWYKIRYKIRKIHR